MEMEPIREYDIRYTSFFIIKQSKCIAFSRFRLIKEIWSRVLGSDLRVLIDFVNSFHDEFHESGKPFKLT